MIHIDTKEEEELEMISFAFKVEREWKKSLVKFANKELLEIFPEAKSVIFQKLAELEEEKNNLMESIKNKLLNIRQETGDKEEQKINREWIKLTDGIRALEVERQIKRLKGILEVTAGKKHKGWVDNDDIQKALAVPIETLIEGPFKKGMKTLIGLCPLHKEKHASFCIYPNSNSCWCFGCNQGGDAIKFIRLLYGFNFKQAVKFLLEK